MLNITIEIDIENAAEVAKKEMGAAAGFIPKNFLKSKVEEAVKKEIIKILGKNIKDKLKERGIQASVNIR